MTVSETLGATATPDDATDNVAFLLTMSLLLGVHIMLCFIKNRFLLIVTALFIIGCSVFLFQGVSLAADDTDEQEADENSSSASTGTYQANHRLDLKFTHRSATVAGETVTDQDLTGKIRVDVARTDGQGYEVHVFGVGRYDLDGNQDETGYTPFEDAGDTQGQFRAKIYEAHLDINRMAAFSQIRLGRQAGTRGEWLYFDGFAADLSLSSDLDVTVYAGAAVHFDEKNAETDPLAGIGFDYDLLSSSKLFFDVLSLKDVRDSRKGTTDQNDLLTSLKYWQRFSDRSKASAKIRTVNGEARDLKIRSNTLALFDMLDLNVTYFRQLQVQNELSNEISTFYDVLGQSNPYHSVDVNGHFRLGDAYSFDVGYFQRSLLDQKDESPFNRAYQRNLIIFEIRDILVDRLSVTLNTEQWDSDVFKGNSSGGDLEYRTGPGSKSMKFNVGSYFSLFKYDYYQDLGERTTAQTVYAKAKIPIGESFSVRFEVESETSIEEYQTVKIGVRRDF
ncbi:MAG: hypothetical protein HQ517_08155 [SAR324 cluster bacterium]|nr:hypothetical protein [SAR324 cluster bacterium]